MSMGAGEGDNVWIAYAEDQTHFTGNPLHHSRAQFGGAGPPGALGAEPLASEDTNLGGVL